MVTRIFKDDYGNRGTLDVSQRFPYNGSWKKQNAYRICLYDAEDYLYHVSVYETEHEAVDSLKPFSCGSFEEVVIS